MQIGIQLELTRELRLEQRIGLAGTQKLEFKLGERYLEKNGHYGSTAIKKAFGIGQ